MDAFFMKQALKEAEKAYHSQEVPIGAIIVFQNKIICRGYNQVERFQDVTFHAEMQCIRQASQILSNWRLAEASLYCTLEPCLMCAGAIFLARIPTLVWAAPDIRHGANGSLTDVFSLKHPTHKVEIRKGILQEESSALLKKFFQQRRLCKKLLVN